MALPTFCRDVLTITRPGVKDSRGVSIPDWDNTTTHTISGCSVQPQDTDTVFDAREAIIVHAKLFLPPGADIQAGDKVTFDGVDYAILGKPLPITSPTGHLSHIRAALVDWEG